MYQCQVYRKPENKARGWRCGQRSAPRDARWAEKGGGCVCGRNRVTLQQKMISTIAVQQSRETQGLELFLFQAQQQSQYRTASLLLVHLWLSCILCYGQKAFHRRKLFIFKSWKRNQLFQMPQFRAVETEALKGRAALPLPPSSSVGKLMLDQGLIDHWSHFSLNFQSACWASV